MAASERFIDVSHTIEHGMVTYKGFPAPIICDWMSREASRAKYEEGTEFQIGKIEMIANTGTYIDSPFHRYQLGKDLSELPLESIADLDCVVVRVGSVGAIDRIDLPAERVRGSAVLWRAHAFFAVPAKVKGLEHFPFAHLYEDES